MERRTAATPVPWLPGGWGILLRLRRRRCYAACTWCLLGSRRLGGRGSWLRGFEGEVDAPAGVSGGEAVDLAEGRGRVGVEGLIDDDDLTVVGEGVGRGEVSLTVIEGRGAEFAEDGPAVGGHETGAGGAALSGGVEGGFEEGVGGVDGCPALG